jgi:hypothetical protein
MTHRSTLNGGCLLLRLVVWLAPDRVWSVLGAQSFWPLVPRQSAALPFRRGVRLLLLSSLPVERSVHGARSAAVSSRLARERGTSLGQRAWLDCRDRSGEARWGCADRGERRGRREMQRAGMSVCAARWQLGSLPSQSSSLVMVGAVRCCSRAMGAAMGSRSLRQLEVRREVLDGHGRPPRRGATMRTTQDVR